MRAEHGAGPALHVFLLGGFRAEREGAIVPDAAWQRRSAKALVKLLALSPGHTLHREQIIDLLWPDADFHSAQNSLAKSLYAARHALEPDLLPGIPSHHLARHDERIALEATWIDIETFGELAEEALLTGDVSALERARTAYTGELLPEDRYADWAAAPRDRLNELALQIRLALARRHEEEGRYGAAIECLQEAVTLDRAREASHRELMRIYLASGSRHEAVHQYQRCCSILREELDVEPEVETSELYRQILSGTRQHVSPSPAGFAPLPALLAPLATTVLMGRAEMLDILRMHWRQAAEGRGTLVLVGGEAGVGKSRLVAELTREAQHDGALILAGGSYPHEGTLPYGPIVEALEEALRARPDIHHQQDIRGHPELSRLLPSLQPGTASPQPESSGRSRLFAAVVTLLDKLAGALPVALVLDDLHAADPESLQLLHHLARIAPRKRWLLLGTYREEDATPSTTLYTLLAAMPARGLARRLDLGRLSRVDTDKLVRQLLPGGSIPSFILDHFYVRSLGNPLFVHQLLRGAQEEGLLRLNDGMWSLTDGEETVPRDIRAIVEARLDRMSEAGRRVLGLAAVAGMEPSFIELRQAARDALGMTELALIDGLDRALEMRVLEEQGAGYHFLHPLLRETLYHQLSKVRRQQFHRAMARTLEEQQPEAVERLAFHYGRGEEDEKAIVYLEQAADRAESIYAHQAAETYYREVLQRLAGRGRAGHEAYVREKLSAVLTTMGRYDEAMTVLESNATALGADGDREALTRVTAAIGTVHHLQANPVEGIRRLEAFVETIPAGEAASSALATLFTVLARLYWVNGQSEDALAAAERASCAAQTAGNGAIWAEAELRRGTVLAELGVDGAVRVLEHGLRLAEQGGRPEAVAMGLNNLAMQHWLVGDVARHLTYRQRALEVVERIGNPARIGFALTALAEALMLSGDWEGTGTHLERALSLLHPLGRSHDSAYPLYLMGRLCLRRGNYREGERYLTLAEDMAVSGNDLQAQMLTEVAWAEGALLAGQPGEAIDRLEPRIERAAHANTLAIYVEGVLGQAYVATGAIERALSLADEVIVRAAAGNQQFRILEALHIRGMALAQRGEWDAASTAFDRSLSLAHAAPYPFGEAQSLHQYGMMCQRKRELRRARSCLNTALAIFHRLGAHAYVDRVQRTEVPPPAESLPAINSHAAT